MPAYHIILLLAHRARSSVTEELSNNSISHHISASLTSRCRRRTRKHSRLASFVATQQHHVCTPRAPPRITHTSNGGRLRRACAARLRTAQWMMPPMEGRRKGRKPGHHIISTNECLCRTAIYRTIRRCSAIYEDPSNATYLLRTTFHCYRLLNRAKEKKKILMARCSVATKTTWRNGGHEGGPVAANTLSIIVAKM